MGGLLTMRVFHVAFILLANCGVRALDKTDVIVVGAGYAGLSAARDLVKANHTVVLLEAEDRVGGRGYDYATTAGDGSSHFVTEMGVEFLGTQKQSPHAYQLFQNELGLSTYASGAYTANSTQKLMCRNLNGKLLEIGGPLLIAQLFRCVSAPAAAEAAAVVAELEALTHEIDATKPWAHPRAVEFDGITWDAFMRQRLGDEARQFINRGYAPGLSDAPERVSFLHALFLAKTGGGLIEGLTGFNNGYRITQGGAAAANIMAQELGDAVKLNSAVTRIDRSEGHVVVSTHSGELFTADKAQHGTDSSAHTCILQWAVSNS